VCHVVGALGKLAEPTLEAIEGRRPFVAVGRDEDELAAVREDAAVDAGREQRPAEPLGLLASQVPRARARLDEDGWFVVDQ